MNTITLKINGQEISVTEGSTILEAAKAAGIYIPTLCHVKGLSSESACRVCVVELSNGRLVPACSTAAQAGMDIQTDSPKVRQARRTTMELLCEFHRMDCDNCVRYSDCEFHDICSKAGINSDDYETFSIPREEDRSSSCIVRDISKCILCRRCIAACSAQGLDLISAYGRGPLTKVGTVLPFSKSGCVNCGQCVAVCPTGSLYEVNETGEVWKALRSRSKQTAVIMTPEVGAMISEALHTAGSAGDERKLTELLRRMGFDSVFSTSDVSGYRKSLLAEEAGKKGAVIDAACPSAAKMIHMYYPDKEAELSAVPSPAALAAKCIRRDKPDAFIVYISTCLAVKEAKQAWGLDAALTVPELVSMIHRACVSRSTAIDVWRRIEGGETDQLVLPDYAAAEAASEPEIISGLAKVSAFLNDHKEIRGTVRLRACPEGCINGGGQIRQTSADLSDNRRSDNRKALADLFR